jgi:hypothetical protein
MLIDIYHDSTSTTRNTGTNIHNDLYLSSYIYNWVDFSLMVLVLLQEEEKEKEMTSRSIVYDVLIKHLNPVTNRNFDRCVIELSKLVIDEEKLLTLILEVRQATINEINKSDALSKPKEFNPLEWIEKYKNY